MPPSSWGKAAPQQNHLTSGRQWKIEHLRSSVSSMFGRDSSAAVLRQIHLSTLFQVSHSLFHFSNQGLIRKLLRLKRANHMIRRHLPQVAKASESDGKSGAARQLNGSSVSVTAGSAQKVGVTINGLDAPGPDGIREPAPIYIHEVHSLDASFGFGGFRSNLTQRATATALDRYPVKRSPRINSAHIVLAFLFATATAATLFSVDVEIAL
jgi:hypothetical protein